jgi:hypothetical protein
MEPPEQPRQIERLWPDAEHGPFRLRLWFGRVNGRPAVVGVEMWGVLPEEAPWVTLLPDSPDTPMKADLPAAPILAEDIRLPLGALRDDWTEMHLAFARAARKLYSEAPGTKVKVRRIEERFERKHTGRPRLSDEFLSRVTAIYNAAVSEGDRRPAKRLIKELGPAAPETARGWIRQARQRGLPVVAAPNTRR